MNTRNKTLLAVTGLVVVVVVVVAIVLVMNQGPTTPGAPVTINGCTLKGGANCPGIDLSNQNMNGVNIARGNFKGARFNGSSMAGANVGSTDFTGAEFKNTTLGGASLSGANFTNANLTSAILTNSTGFDSANWTGAIFCKTYLPNGSQRTDPGRVC